MFYKNTLMLSWFFLVCILCASVSAVSASEQVDMVKGLIGRVLGDVAFLPPP